MFRDKVTNFMAQTLYDTSPTRSQFHQYNSNVEPSSHMTDTMSVSTNLSQLNNMSHNRSAPKKRQSRLELLRSDFTKRLQLEKEEKITKLKAIQQENRLKQGNNGAGVVREFFAERRAMEATRKGQKNPELLPPIESHFKMVKEQKQDNQSLGLVNRQQLGKTNAPPGKRISLKQEPPTPQKPLPSKYSTRTSAIHANIGVVARKRTKGIDKQDPLPPVNKGGSNATRRKPPTPNKRYETHSFLVQDHSEDFEPPGPFMPVPPIQKKPNAKRSKVSLPPPSGEESASDFDDAQSTLTDYSSVAPNLSKLKAKALKQRQLSKQKLITANQNQDVVDSGKLTDFQKWQMEQDRERAERLAKHEQKSELSLSQRENDLLNKIKEEQSRLENLKQQRKELEEHEKRQKEEDEKWMAEKRKLEHHAILPEQYDNPTEDSELTKKIIPKKAPKPHKPPVKKETLPPKRTPEEELDESENIHNAYNNFYDEATKDLGEVSLDVTPCSICRRNFAPDRLAKHEKVCAKNSKSKRKVFDTRKHRAVGTEHEKYVESGKYLEEPKKRPKADWRAQHENFIKAIRYAKGLSNEPPPPTENPDYVQCPHCERKFNPSTAERHIPKCKDIKAKPAPLKKKR